jgi:catechol 2,3-dioxygenase-like lactoylglutathione lyase family enzyme
MHMSTPEPPYVSGQLSRRELLLSLPALAVAGSAFAQTIDMPSLRVRGINHVTLSVSDVKRTVDFYQGLFGMPVISRQGMTTNLQIGAGPQFLEIAPASGAPSISHIGLAIEDFSAERVAAVLAKRGLTSADPGAGATGLGGPLRIRTTRRGADAGGAKDGTPELFMTDPDGVVLQLQDPKYCGGSGALGDVAAREASPKKGLIALRDWSHCTIFGSDGARANKFYQDLFNARIQAYQGANAPVMGVGGVQFLMLAGGGGRGRGGGGGAASGRIDHLCMNLDGFDSDAIIKTLESYGIKPRGQGQSGPLVHYISTRMENRGGAKEGTEELYFTDPDGLLIQLQDTKYCGGAGLLGEVCQA